MLAIRQTPAAVVFASALSCISGLALAEEMPYDYYHATSCFAHGMDSSRVPERRMELDASGPYIEAPEDQSGWVFCPITRIYPRHPGRLLRISVDLELSSAAKSSLPRTVAVCASRTMDEWGETCEHNREVSGIGKKRVTLEPVIFTTQPGLSYDYYMYIVVYIEGGDRIYGYRADFDLR